MDLRRFKSLPIAIRLNIRRRRSQKAISRPCRGVCSTKKTKSRILSEKQSVLELEDKENTIVTCHELQEEPIDYGHYFPDVCGSDIGSGDQDVALPDCSQLIAYDEHKIPYQLKRLQLNEFPVELLIEIFGYLDYRDLTVNIPLTCRRFYQVISNVHSGPIGRNLFQCKYLSRHCYVCFMKKLDIYKSYIAHRHLYYFSYGLLSTDPSLDTFHLSSCGYILHPIFHRLAFDWKILRSRQLRLEDIMISKRRIIEVHDYRNENTNDINSNDYLCNYSVRDSQFNLDNADQTTTTYSPLSTCSTLATNSALSPPRNAVVLEWIIRLWEIDDDETDQPLAVCTGSNERGLTVGEIVCAMVDRVNRNRRSVGELTRMNWGRRMVGQMLYLCYNVIHVRVGLGMCCDEMPMEHLHTSEEDFGKRVVGGEILCV